MEREDQLCHVIKNINNQIFRRVNQKLAQNPDIDSETARSGWILGYLITHEDETLYQKDIEERFDLARSTVTGLLKPMEQKGYITRENSKQDARLKRIMITDLGKEAHNKSMSCVHEVEEELNSILTPEEAEEAYRLLRKVRKGMKDICQSDGCCKA